MARASFAPQISHSIEAIIKNFDLSGDLAFSITIHETGLGRRCSRYALLSKVKWRVQGCRRAIWSWLPLYVSLSRLIRNDRMIHYPYNGLYSITCLLPALWWTYFWWKEPFIFLQEYFGSSFLALSLFLLHSTFLTPSALFFFFFFFLFFFCFLLFLSLHRGNTLSTSWVTVLQMTILLLI